MVELLNKLNGKNRRGFTLIEMLVVIAVIAILASIIIGVLPGARNKTIRSTVKTDMKAIETAIEGYKSKHNVFPPDNPKDHSRPPLYYELTGTTNDTTKWWSRAAVGDTPFDQNELRTIFNIDGFLNTSQAADEVDAPSFYKNLLARQVRVMDDKSRPYKVLVAPRDGPDKKPAVWHYNKSNPTNNVGEYDLWAEIDIGGDKVIIGNWEN